MSSNHHYIPEFYLKGFTNTEGLFAIYDCKKGIVNTKMYHPASHFYEKNRNTVEFKGSKTNAVEEAYSKQESRHSKVIQFVQQSNLPPVLDLDQMTQLQEFMAQMYWRIPATDGLYAEKLSRDPIFTGIFKVVNKATGEVDDEYTKEILSSPEVLKAFRWFAQFTSILTSPNSFDFGNWLISYSSRGLNVCSDNPIIFKTDIEENPFDADFICPLSKNHFLIRTLKKIEILEMPPEIGLQISMIILKQAKFFCCASEMDFLNAVADLSKKYSLEALKNRVFAYIEQDCK